MQQLNPTGLRKVLGKGWVPSALGYPSSGEGTVCESLPPLQVAITGSCPCDGWAGKGTFPNLPSSVGPGEAVQVGPALMAGAGRAGPVISWAARRKIP